MPASGMSTGRSMIGEGAHLADADGDVTAWSPTRSRSALIDDRQDEAKIDGHGLLHGEESRAPSDRSRVRGD